MSTLLVNSKEELIMKLVHYFITKENYALIVVNGVKDEIWLENSDGPYRIVRINSNYIHNNEQYEFDVFKTRNIMKQIKKKTLSLSISALNIFLDVNPDVKLNPDKDVESIKITSLKDVKSQNGLSKFFPKVKDDLIDNTDGVELIVNVTKDINEKTERENKVYENIFKPKKIIITPIIIAINVLLFLLVNSPLNESIIDKFAVLGLDVRAGEIYRLITGAFLHANAVHLFCNMYALYLIGSQVESYVGKNKFSLIYLISALTGSLMSIAFSENFSIGASGAIFGLMGSLVYFGYHYRLYLRQALTKKIIPIIFINLIFGMMIENIDIAAHIGGLVGGFLITVALGVSGKSKSKEKINGWIVSALYIAFLIYISIFNK